MKSLLRYGLSVVLIASVTAGCGGGDEEPAKPAAPAKVEAPAEVAPVAATPATAPPPIDVSAPPPMAGSAAPAAAAAPEVPSKDALEAVTHATQSFVVQFERAPKSLDELVSSGYLRKLPTPPAGKKYVYVPEKMSITLADQ